MPSVNLAPGTQYLRQVRRRQRRLLLLASVVVIIAGGVWAGLFLYGNSLAENLQNVEGRLRTVEVEIAELEPVANRIVLFESRLEVLDELLDEHISWDGLLGSIEELLPADTVLISITVRGDRGTVEFQGTTPSIDSVALALASLTTSDDRETIFQSGKLSGINREATQVEGEDVAVQYTFNGELQFNPDILKSGS